MIVIFYFENFYKKKEEKLKKDGQRKSKARFFAPLALHSE